MLNPELKLNQKVFEKDVEQKPIREGFGIGLCEAGKRDANIVGLCADLVDSTKMNLFRDAFPKRFIEVGVAEQNLASVASGMAAMGKIPVISSYAMFSPGRNWEQIRTTICYNDRKVVIAGSHAGLSVGPDGGSHQALEDIALTRIIPNMTVFSPCDVLEAQRITEFALSSEIKTPVYIRLAREKTPIITTADTPFSGCDAQLVFVPKTAGTRAQIGIIASGGILYQALVAARELEEKYGFSVKVLYVPCIKPIDVKSIITLAEEAGRLITVEEHQVYGGLGSAVSEVVVSEMKNPVPIKFIAVQDQFGQSGTPQELFKYYGIDSDNIVLLAKQMIESKS